MLVGQSRFGKICRHRCCDKAAEHQANHGELGEGKRGAGEVLQIHGEHAVATEAGEYALVDRPRQQDGEFIRGIRLLENFDGESTEGVDAVPPSFTNWLIAQSNCEKLISYDVPSTKHFS